MSTTTAHPTVTALSGLVTALAGDACLTVADLAHRAATPESRVAALLDGTAVWTLPELYRIALALDRSPVDLFRLAEQRAGEEAGR